MNSRDIVDAVMDSINDDSPETIKEYAFIREQLRKALDADSIERIMDHIQDAVIYGQIQAAEVAAVQMASI